MSKKFNFNTYEFFAPKLNWIFLRGHFSIWPPFFQTFQTICATQNFFWQLDLDYEVSFSRIVRKRLCVLYLSFQSIYPVPSLWVIDYISYRKDFLSQIDPHELFNQILSKAIFSKLFMDRKLVETPCVINLLMKRLVWILGDLLI